MGKVGGLHRVFLKSSRARKPAAFGYRAILTDAGQSLEDYVLRDNLEALGPASNELSYVRELGQHRQ